MKKLKKVFVFVLFFCFAVGTIVAQTQKNWKYLWERTHIIGSTNMQMGWDKEKDSVFLIDSTGQRQEFPIKREEVKLDYVLVFNEYGRQTHRLKGIYHGNYTNKKGEHILIFSSKSESLESGKKMLEEYIAYENGGGDSIVSIVPYQILWEEAREEYSYYNKEEYFPMGRDLKKIETFFKTSRKWKEIKQFSDENRLFTLK
jgi:hypothetical protein